MDLATVLASIARDGDAFTLPAPEGWNQGRALYGGVAAALALAAARRATPGLPPLRSAQVAFLAPAPGALRLSVETLRTGRSAVVVSVDCTGEAGLATRTMLTFGAARESGIAYDRVPAPQVPRPEACPRTPEGAPAPDFFHNFEARPAGGAAPLSRAAVDEVLFWVRFAGDAGADPELALLAMGDVLPPAALVSFDRIAPISSMTWQIDLAQPAVVPDWYLVRSLGEQAGDGYARQTMACWGDDGRCLAVGRQTVAVFA